MTLTPATFPLPAADIDDWSAQLADLFTSVANTFASDTPTPQQQQQPPVQFPLPDTATTIDWGALDAALSRGAEGSFLPPDFLSSFTGSVVSNLAENAGALSKLASLSPYIQKSSTGSEQLGSTMLQQIQNSPLVQQLMGSSGNAGALLDTLAAGGRGLGSGLLQQLASSNLDLGSLMQATRPLLGSMAGASTASLFGGQQQPLASSQPAATTMVASSTTLTGEAQVNDLMQQLNVAVQAIDSSIDMQQLQQMLQGD